jgi:hypothetical protein
MAKAQAIKSKSSFGGWFKGFGGSKAKATRPTGTVQSTTMTNIPAHGSAA